MAIKRQYIEDKDLKATRQTASFRLNSPAQQKHKVCRPTLQRVMSVSQKYHLWISTELFVKIQHNVRHVLTYCQKMK